MRFHRRLPPQPEVRYDAPVSRCTKTPPPLLLFISLISLAGCVDSPLEVKSPIEVGDANHPAKGVAGDVIPLPPIEVIAPPGGGGGGDCGPYMDEGECDDGPICMNSVPGCGIGIASCEPGRRWR